MHKHRDGVHGAAAASSRQLEDAPDAPLQRNAEPPHQEGVDYVLVGSVRWSGAAENSKSVRVTIELLQARDEREPDRLARLVAVPPHELAAGRVDPCLLVQDVDRLQAVALRQRVEEGVPLEAESAVQEHDEAFWFSARGRGDGAPAGSRRRGTSPPSPATPPSSAAPSA